MESVTGDGDRNAVSVNDAPLQPPTFASSSRFYLSFTDLFILYAFALFYLFELATVRWEFKKEKKSPFDTHAGLMIISFVSLFVAALATGVLFYAQKYLQSSMRDTHCNILGVICYFFGFLPSLCLLLVLGLPQNRIWIGYLVICVLFMIVVACYFTICMTVDQNDVSSLQPPQVIQDDKCPVNVSYILLPLPIMLVLFVPSNLDWIRYSVYGITFGTFVAYNIFAYMKTVKKKKALKVESRQMAQQDNSEIAI